MAEAVVFCDNCGGGINLVTGQQIFKCQKCGEVVCSNCIKNCEHTSKNLCLKCYNSRERKQFIEQKEEVERLSELGKEERKIKEEREAIEFWNGVWKDINKFDGLTINLESSSRKSFISKKKKTEYIPICYYCRDTITKENAQPIKYGEDEKKFCPYVCNNCFSERNCSHLAMGNAMNYLANPKYKCHVHSTWVKCSEYIKKK